MPTCCPLHGNLCNYYAVKHHYHPIRAGTSIRHADCKGIEGYYLLKVMRGHMFYNRIYIKVKQCVHYIGHLCVAFKCDVLHEVWNILMFNPQRLV